MTNTTIAGEPIDLLLDALRSMKGTPRPDGMVHITGELEPDVAVPFLRALLRTEADELRAEADGLVSTSDIRTEEQRRADALVALVVKISAAA